MVTGAARGIGRAVAARLADDGWRVLATDRDVAPLATDGHGFIVEPLDVTDRPGVVALLDRYGPPSLAVCNAGVGGAQHPLGEMPRAAFDVLLRINLLGCFIVAQEAAQRMESGGTIVMIASRSHLSSVNAMHYGMTKGAVVGLMRAMANAYRWRGISVNAVSPGLTDTEILRSLSTDHVDRMVALEPSGAPIDPTMMAGAVAHLASPAGQCMRGQNLLVDDGKSIGIAPW